MATEKKRFRNNRFIYPYKKVFLLLTILIASTGIVAQTTTQQLSGRILDADTKQPIPYASIQLFLLPDSIFVAGVTSQENGNFSFSVTPAPSSSTQYLLSISYLGYGKINKRIDLPGTHTNLKVADILLPPDGITLTETVITAQAVMAVTENDTTVFNSAAYRTPGGAMLEELVKQLPGSEITFDGRILIQGKEVKKIMIDGKEFFSDNPKTALKNLPVEMVEKIKAYERQSDLERLTGIDDGDGEMVLDLSVKKEMKNKWMDNFFGGIGTKERYEGANTLNHMRDDMQLTIIANLNNTNNQGFSEMQQESATASMNIPIKRGILTSRSLGINFSKDWERIKTRTNIQYGNTENVATNTTTIDNFLKAEKSITESNGNSNDKTGNLLANAFIEWKIDPATTLIFRPTFRYTSADRYNNNYQKNWADDILLNEKDAETHNDNSQYNTNFILQVNRKFTKKGRNIALRLDYGLNGSTANRLNYATTHYFKSGKEKVTNQKIDNTGSGYNYRLQLLYSEPLKRNYFLQLRYIYQHRNSTSDRMTYNWDEETGEFDYIPDTLGSNSFENLYDTHLFNLSLRSVKKKYNYTVGLDLEPQRSIGRTLIEEEEKYRITKQVFNFSPTLNFRYKYSKHSQLQVIYRGKSRQPNIRNLQPIADMTNPLNIRMGNPNLKPSYLNTFTLNYTNYNSKHQRNTILNLMVENTLNAVTNQVTYDNETGGRITTPVNINGNWRMLGSFSLNTPFRNRNWIFKSSTNLQYNRTNGYTTVNKEDPAKNTVQHFTARERLVVTYRSKHFEIGGRADAIYNHSYNNVQATPNNTCDLVTGADLLGYLPWEMEIFSDLSYYLRSGYGYTGNGKKSLIWNTQLTKSFFKRKQLMLRFKVYDILQQETSLMRTITTTSIRDTEYNVLGCYFMGHIVLKF